MQAVYISYFLLVVAFHCDLSAISCPHLLIQVFIETAGVVIPLGVASVSGVENALVRVASVSEVAEPVVAALEPGVASVSEAAEPVVAFLEPEVVSVAEVAEPVVAVVEPEVVSVAEVAEPVVAVVVVAFEPQVSVDSALAFDVLAPVSVVAVEVDSPGCPRFLAFPNID